jgi:hypothetical protein
VWVWEIPGSEISTKILRSGQEEIQEKSAVLLSVQFPVPDRVAGTKILRSLDLDSFLQKFPDIPCYFPVFAVAGHDDRKEK